MFTRKDLKQRAKSVLKKNYWTALALVALIYIAELALSSAIWVLIFPTTFIATVYTGYSELITSVFQLVTSGFVAVISIFLMPLNVGLFKSLIKSSEDGQGEIKDIIWGYKNNFGNILSAYVKIFLIIFALSFISMAFWCLGMFGSMYIRPDFIVSETAFEFFAVSAALLFAFIGSIPAIIKTYDYYLAGFILADEPDLTSKEVLKRSKALMKGHRFFAFKLDISFIGWEFLGALCCCGLGMIFVTPYIYQTQTEFYLELAGKKTKEPVFETTFEDLGSEEPKEENF